MVTAPRRGLVARAAVKVVRLALAAPRATVALAAAADRPYLVAALLHSNLTPEATFEDLEHIARARSHGRRMYGAVSACPLNFEFTLHEPYVFEGLAAWQPLMKMEEPDVKKALGAVLALLAGAVACLVANDGTVPADQLALAAFVALLASDKSYDYLWGPTNAFMALHTKTGNFGIGGK